MRIPIMAICIYVHVERRRASRKADATGALYLTREFAANIIMLGREQGVEDEIGDMRTFSRDMWILVWLMCLSQVRNDFKCTA